MVGWVEVHKATASREGLESSPWRPPISTRIFIGPIPAHHATEHLRPTQGSPHQFALDPQVFVVVSRKRSTGGGRAGLILAFQSKGGRDAVGL